MKIDEVAGRVAPRKFPMATLAAQTLLYHGTNTAGDFSIPDGPAWFTFTAEAAQSYIGWGGVATGRTEGPGRVLVVQVYRDTPLVDTRSERVWRAFCEALTGDPEVGGGWMAEAVKKAGYVGWLGGTEVMLSEPLNHVYPRGLVKNG